MNTGVRPGLSVVVVNYNGAGFLDACLRTLAAQSEPGWETVVVDNASTDASADGLEDRHPGLKVIRNRHNVGFGAATNQGVAATTGSNVLLLNPDVELAPGAIRVGLDHLEQNPDIDVIGARVLLPDGRLDPPARRSFKTPMTYLYKVTGLTRMFPRHPRFGRYYLGHLDAGEVADVDAVVGAFMLTRRAVFDRVGPLDERFFMYCEDEDWCWRVKQSGGRVVYHPGVVVRHRKGSSSRQARARMVYHFHRSLYLYHRKNIAPRYAAPVNVAVYTGIAGGMLAGLAAAAVARVLGRGR